MEKLLLFFVVSLVSTATPGPAVLYVTSQGVGGGMRSAIPSSIGILAADAFYILLSITGLGTVILASYSLFTAIKMVGAVYLVYLGARLLWAGLAASSGHAPAPAVASRPRKAFIGGFVLHAANPKALLYFGSLVPQFVDPSRGLLGQFGSLAFIHLATASVVLLLYSVLASRFRRSAAGQRVRRVFHVATGSVLVGAGVSLALARRGGR